MRCPRRALVLLGACAALVALMAACGDDDGGPTGAGTVATGEQPATEDGEAKFPVTLETEAGTATIAARPERIVSLSATATEMLFAIGAGDQVVAVDDQSDHPGEAPVTGLSGFEPSVEAVAAYEPDLVVIAFDPGGLVDALGALDVPVLLHPAVSTLDGAYTQFEQLGAATGHLGEAAEVVAGMQSDLDAIAASLPDLDAPLRVYHELDDTLYSASSGSFIGELYARAGLENIADGADDGSGYPQLSAEYVISQDPDLIFLADTVCCGQDAGTVAARPGWADLAAVRNGGVIELDDDIASRWGPRAVELFQAIVAAVEQAAEVRIG